MDMSMSNRYFQITKINLKHNFLPHLALGIILLLITPVIFSISNLDTSASWTPLEMFVSLIGIILLVHTFIPEQDAEIADVVLSKSTSLSAVYIARVIYSICAVVLLILFFGLGMSISGSEISLIHILGTIANAVFLGSLGMLALSISSNVAVSYMVPLIYYAMNFAGGKHLYNFYLFSGISGSYHEKAWLFGIGIIFICASLLIKHIVQKSKEG